MDAKLGNVVVLVLAVAIIVMFLLYLRRRGMSTRRMLGILPIFVILLLEVTLRLFGVLSEPVFSVVTLLSVIALFVIALAIIAWSRWQSSRTP